MGKQSGFLFYVPAWNTSKIDPATGFVNFLQPVYESVEKAKSFFGKFDSIHFNKKKAGLNFHLIIINSQPKQKIQWQNGRFVQLQKCVMYGINH